MLLTQKSTLRKVILQKQGNEGTYGKELPQPSKEHL